MLSDPDADANDLHTLTINEHYAKSFEYRKEREELAKLKEKYGADYSGSGASDADDSEDLENTEEDSDGEELTPAVDAAILRTLALIRKKDPAIYEGDRRVFDEEHTRTHDRAPVAKSRAKEKSKPLTIRQAALANALAEADADSRSTSPQPRPLTHTEEQALLRSETRAAFHVVADFEAQGGEDDLLIPRSHTRDEIELEEEEYKAFLEREVGEGLCNLVTVEPNEVVVTSEDVGVTADGGEAKKKKGKKERDKEKERNRDKTEAQGKRTKKQQGKRSKEEADQEFLMNYIVSRGWIDRSNGRVPTYNEIVESSKQSKWESAESNIGPHGGNGVHPNPEDELGTTLSDENSFDDLVDAFETSYNFRFEEPGGALISSFPRNVSSVRRESTTRKDARGRKKERQEAEKQALLAARRGEIRRERTLVEAAVAEDKGHALATGEDTSEKKKLKKQQRKEELARLRVLKTKELRRKLEMVSSEGGLGNISDEGFTHLDLDADWDAAKHDARMAVLYGDDDGIGDDDDAKKPTWDDDINIDDIESHSNTKLKAEPKKLKKKKKKKKKNVDEDVGVDVDDMDADLDAGRNWDDWDDSEEWNGTEEERKRKVDAYMDEVVNRLGFSGIMSHVPTRFHYTSTTSEAYGLTPAEILLATDVELNSYVGLKKMAPYRINKGGKAKNWDPKRTQRLKEFRENLRTRVGSKCEGPWSLEAGTNSKIRNRASESQGEKKRIGKKERAKLKAVQDGNDGEENASNRQDAEIKSQKRKHGPDAGPHPPLDEDGARKKRRRRRHKEGPGGLDDV